jgi:hypothetical protein
MKTDARACSVTRVGCNRWRPSEGNGDQPSDSGKCTHNRKNEPLDHLTAQLN